MTEYVIHPEPEGCRCQPGFVKANPANNAAYIAMCAEVYPPNWMEVIVETDAKLEELVPGYNIAQIKEKFWTLVYYIHFPDGTDEETARRAHEITDEAAYKAGQFQSGGMAPPPGFPNPFWADDKD